MARQSRDRWTNRTAFIMAAVGSAVGLGNLWRFPYVAFQNGGGAFFLPYFVALISAGIPLMIVEYALGQKFQGGAPKALAAVTSKFRWVGWFALLVGLTITFYYAVVMSWAWRYCAESLRVAWQHPAPAYELDEGPDGAPLMAEIPAGRVRIYVPAQTQEQKQRELAVQKQRAEQERLPVYLPEEMERARQENPGVHFVSLNQNVANYFQQSVLGGFRPDVWIAARQFARGDPPASEAPAPQAERAPPEEDPPAEATGGQKGSLKAALADRQGMLKLDLSLVIGALLTWLLIFLIIFKGVHNVGKVVMVTVPLPVILLLIVVIRGVTLPGAMEGLIYYLKPNWEMLKNPDVWIAAYGQIFFSLSLGFGILIAYASYMPPDSDVTNSAFITSLGNCATSFIAGLAVFSVLGYLAYIQGQAIDNVVTGGPGLVFVTYPIALLKMPMGQFGIAVISFLFFITLITLGIDSAFSLVEGVVTGFLDRFPMINRASMTALFCTVGFVGSLVFCTRSGLMWLDIVDRFMNQYGLPLVGLMECIAVGYFFQLDELKDYINRHSEIKIHNWFDAFVKVITPGILIYLLAQQFLTDIAETYGGYDAVLEHAVTAAGWGWFAVAICAALLLSRHYYAIFGVASAGVLFGLGSAYLHFATERPWGDVLGAAGMGAVAVVLLFGGLAACIAIAMKTHHRAGLSMEEQETPEPLEPAGD